MHSISDIFVVGGGINGAGIARDAAGRGLKVTLAEKDDLASHTSSASSKLIHGGLRYLEHYEFKLVRESLIEREILLQSAPHLIRPMRFILPHHKGLRPAFILRLGLFLYDYIGGRKLLPPTEVRALRKHTSGAPLKERYTKGFEYSDCWVDDARLVILAARDAENKGANILTQHEVIKATRENRIWHITVRNSQNEETTYKARALVNAAGPWVDDIEAKSSPAPDSRKNIRMVKGSHIIVPKVYDGAQAYTFQGGDNRVVFAIPYEEDYTLIGTTDVPFEADPNSVKINDTEKEYLCQLASNYFRRTIKPETIVWSYSGVRPLVDDGEKNASKTTRDYVLELDTKENAPLLSIYGGKITTFRHLAEEALEKLKPLLGFDEGTWTKDAHLPGAVGLNYADMDFFNTRIKHDYPFLPRALRLRFIEAYGNDIHSILEGCTSIEDMGQHFGACLYEAELKFMRDREWATCAEDALWRRSKLGLRLTAAEIEDVENWFQGK
ncbi:glycerol-3-phosphate dehydrogenase [Kordiimonas sp. SCSIO 12603]|uniref:glycerol-3-phosphate dehydrogenase n=1 Tax=Kordiimonas sp. SCSIO 12603 TaxID=2829596 RepID=UPI0021064D23|nr:glycerol-3-phosphate dehydrogenase [Kordiimonas sp. SCSIO 12603]UTW59649.1 glycerol-3-phosphate dehydrogenase [Kordiimonas sp. SCSIO 12603]